MLSGRQERTEVSRPPRTCGRRLRLATTRRSSRCFCPSSPASSSLPSQNPSDNNRATRVCSSSLSSVSSSVPLSSFRYSFWLMSKYHPLFPLCVARRRRLALYTFCCHRIGHRSFHLFSPLVETRWLTLWLRIKRTSASSSGKPSTSASFGCLDPSGQLPPNLPTFSLSSAYRLASESSISRRYKM